MTKIAIINHGSRLHKGGTALLNSRITTLMRYFPDAEFTVFTYHPEVDYGPEAKYIEGANIQFYEVPFRVSLTPRNLSSTLRSIVNMLCCKISLARKPVMKSISRYCDADVIISTGGDCLTEDYGLVSFLNHFTNLLLGVLLKKTVVLYAESIGPFRRKWNRILARFLFNRVNLITLREGISKEYLQTLGVNRTPIYVTADSAFLLEPAPIHRTKEILKKEGIDENTRPIVGISVSKIISRYGLNGFGTERGKHDEYVKLMAEVANWLIEHFNATIVFIPHVMEPWGNDDRTVADEILKTIKNRKRAISIKNEYTAEEFKGIIGQCDLFVGARMHATIASASMLVPTILIAYSHKAYGIIGQMLGYSEYVLDIRDLNYHVLVSAIDKAWQNRTKIKKELEMRIGDVKKRALLNGELARKLVDMTSAR